MTGMMHRVALLQNAMAALCDAYAACNGEDHPAYVRARELLDAAGVRPSAPAAPDCRAETYANGTRCAGCSASWPDDGPDECPEAVPLAPLGVRFPYITVQLSGLNGNAHVILGRVMAAMSRDGVPMTTCNDFRLEAIAGDYDHLLRTCMKWVNVT